MTVQIDELTLTTDNASAKVDLTHGGRLSSLKIDGHELLVTVDERDRAADQFGWGAYPMVPWAGRVAFGRFTVAEAECALPINMGSHSLHGTGFTSSWTRSGDNTITLAFADPWPFPGSVTQTFDLASDSLTCTMVVTAGASMPVMLGWHPWFVRTLGTNATASLDFGQARMYERDQNGIPTGRLVDVPEGPWDDCFTDLSADPTITWGDTMALRLESSCSHWVIYTEPDHALCVEPQSGPPNEFNTEEVRMMAPGNTYEAWFKLTW